MSFVPAHSTVIAPGAQPTSRCFVLHGILGSGRNWRTFARRLALRRPDTAFVLVDLRHHGDSAGAPPPNTVTAAAHDLHELAKAIGEPNQVVGHSFGGKVALRYAQLHGEHLEQVWMLDSRPGRATASLDNEVMAVIGALQRVPLPLKKRSDVVDLLTGWGFSPAIARWMTTNLRRVDEGYVWTFDLNAVVELITDYFELDLWSALRDPIPDVHVVRASRSDRWPEHVLARFESTSPKVHLHTLADSGHWVHVDNPDGLLDMLAAQ